MKKKIIFILVLFGFAWPCKKMGDPISNMEVIPPIKKKIVSKKITTETFTEVSNRAAFFSRFAPTLVFFRC